MSPAQRATGGARTGARRSPSRTSSPKSGAATAPPAFRSAEDVGRTDLGPRPVPPLGSSTRVRKPTVRHADLDSGLHVVAVRVPRTPLVEVRLRIPFGGRTATHAARAELLAASTAMPA